MQIPNFTMMLEGNSDKLVFSKMNGCLLKKYVKWHKNQ